MPGSSPRGLVQGLPMVLLSALSSEHFLTWLLSMLWAGTWHRAASAPEALVLFQTECHRSWLSRASEEGEAGRSRRAAALTHSWLPRGAGVQAGSGEAERTAGGAASCGAARRAGGRTQAAMLPLPKGPERALVLLPARSREVPRGRESQSRVSHPPNVGPVLALFAFLPWCVQLLAGCGGWPDPQLVAGCPETVSSSAWASALHPERSYFCLGWSNST